MTWRTPCIETEGKGRPIRLSDEVQRQGVEIELETLPFYNLSFLGGFAYVEIDPPASDGGETQYTYNVGLMYDDKDSLHVQLFGHYVWWNQDSSSDGKYDDFIWDLNLNKTLYSKKWIKAEVFLTAHNIFNASQYSLGILKNPERWMKGGMRFEF